MTKIQVKVFPRFKWCVPAAFSEALGQCLFTRGDILYHSVRAYEAWDQTFYASGALKYSVQVTYPSRLTSGGTESGSVAEGHEENEQKALGRFKTNWGSRVELDFRTYPEEGQLKHIITTQGRLFTMLWRGSLDIIAPESPSPPVPLLVSDANNKKAQVLEGAVDAFTRRIRDSAHVPILFAFAYDPTNGISAEKYRSIKLALRKVSSDIEEIRLTPEETRVAVYESYSPTLEFCCFAIADTDEGTIRKSLKKALYLPSKDRKTDVDRFDLRKHGLLVTSTS